MPADLLVPDDILRKAEAIILKQKQWPWDDWIGLGDDFDLNLYRGSDMRLGATIYAVRNGNTDTSRWRTLNIRRIQEGGAK